MICDIHSDEFSDGHDECDCHEYDDRRIPDQEEIDDLNRVYSDERKCVHPEGCDWCSWCGEPQKRHRLENADADDFNSSAASKDGGFLESLG